MVTANDNAAPAGLSVIFDRPRGIEYVGPATAYMDAGILQPEWIEGLGRLTRQIALNADGSFTILGGGKGNRITDERRQLGAYSIKRKPNGMLHVTCFRTPAEEQELERERHARYEQEVQQRAWALAASIDADEFTSRWKRNVLRHIEQVAELVRGQLVYEGFPEIALHDADLAAAHDAIERLQQVVASSKPHQPIAEKVAPASNVIQLRRSTYRAIQSA